MHSLLMNSDLQTNDHPMFINSRAVPPCQQPWHKEVNKLYQQRTINRVGWFVTFYSIWSMQIVAIS